MPDRADTIRKLKGTYWRTVVNGTPEGLQMRLKAIRALLEVANAPPPQPLEMDTDKILAFFKERPQ